jgi:hypothetical protein
VGFDVAGLPAQDAIEIRDRGLVLSGVEEAERFIAEVARHLTPGRAPRQRGAKDEHESKSSANRVDPHGSILNRRGTILYPW